MVSEEFKRQLGELSRVVFYASTYYAIWKALRPTEEIVNTLNRHKEFFVPVREALRGLVLIELAKIFDGDRRTISLPNLLAAARRDSGNLAPHGTVENLRQLSRELAKHAGLRERIKQMRSQHLAHLDASASGAAPLPIAEIDALVEGVQDMLNKLSLWHDRSGTSYAFQERNSARATGYILRALRKEAEWIKKAPHEETAEYLREVWGTDG